MKKNKESVILIMSLILLILIIPSLFLHKVRATITELTGIAIAQSPTKWNNLKDAYVGDALVNGLMATGLYAYNGTAWDRVRGTIANGLSVSFPSTAIMVVNGSSTPSDSFANPTNAVTTWSLSGLWNGTTWQRMLSDVSGRLKIIGTDTPSDTFANPINALTTFGLMGVWNGSVWTRWNGVITATSTPPQTALLTLLIASNATGPGSSFYLNSLLSKHTWTISVTNTPSSISTNLEGSIDNSSWYVLDTSISNTTEMRHVVNKPILYLRANITALVTNGSAPVITVKSISGGN
jgi:hypothetical protein